MYEIFLGFLAQISQGQAVGALVTIDSLVPLMAIIAGVAMGMIQIYNTTRNRAVDLSIKSAEDRLDECERHRDIERAKHEATRTALTEAMAKISGLMADLRKTKEDHAGPESP